MPSRLDNLRAQRLAAGLDISDVARLANVSDWMVKQLEEGGTCEGYEAQRIADALVVTLVTLGEKHL